MVAYLAVQLQTFAVTTQGRLILFLRPVHIPQAVQHADHAPLFPNFAAQGQRLLVMHFCLGITALVMAHHAHIFERVGHGSFVAQFAGNVQRLAIQVEGAFVIACIAGENAEVVERGTHARPVANLLANGEGLFVVMASSGRVPLVGS